MPQQSVCSPAGTGVLVYAKFAWKGWAVLIFNHCDNIIITLWHLSPLMKYLSWLYMDCIKARWCCFFRTLQNPMLQYWRGASCCDTYYIIASTAIHPRFQLWLSVPLWCSCLLLCCQYHIPWLQGLSSISCCAPTSVLITPFCVDPYSWYLKMLIKLQLELNFWKLGILLNENNTTGEFWEHKIHCAMLYMLSCD